MTAGSDPWLPQPWIVRAVRRDTADVFTWQLEPLHGAAPGFVPGQFNMLYHFGDGEVAISISGAGEDGRIQHTIRAVGAVTRHLQALDAGAVVGLRGPYGNGWPVEALRGRDVVKGGIFVFSVLNGSDCRLSLPASIRDRSNASLSRRSMCWPER